MPAEAALDVSLVSEWRWFLLWCRGQVDWSLLAVVLVVLATFVRGYYRESIGWTLSGIVLGLLVVVLVRRRIDRPERKRMMQRLTPGSQIIASAALDRRAAQILGHRAGGRSWPQAGQLHLALTSDGRSLNLVLDDHDGEKLVGLPSAFELVISANRSGRICELIVRGRGEQHRLRRPVGSLGRLSDP